MYYILGVMELSIRGHLYPSLTFVVSLCTWDWALVMVFITGKTKQGPLVHVTRDCMTA